MNRLKRLTTGRRLGMMSGGGAAEWTPANLIPLLWLRSDSLDAGAVNDNDAVTTMVDLSGNGRDVTQADAAKKPTLKLNTLNGHPTILFDGTSDWLGRADGFPTSSDYSIFAVCKINDFAKQNNILSGTDQHSLNLGTTQTLKLFHSAAFVTSKVNVPAAAYSVLGGTFATGSKGGIVHINRATVGTGVSALQNTNATIQVGAFNGNYWAAMNLAELIVTPNTMTDANRSRLMDYFTARYGIAASAPTINWVVCEGDSLTAGFGLGTPATEAWPAVLIASKGATWMATNMGVSGKTIATATTAGAANIDTLFDTKVANNPPVVIVWAGTNDLAAGATAAAAYANLSTFITARKATGWRVIALTMIKRGVDAGLETKRGQYNALILANTAGADAVVDVGADAAFDDVTDATYYQADQIHTTAAGHIVVAGLVEVAIDAL